MYHERTLKYVKKKTGLFIQPKSFTPLMLMAPFEILANSDFSYIFADARAKLSKPEFKQVRNLTGEMACRIQERNLISEVTDRRNVYSNENDEELLCRLVLSLLHDVSDGILGNVQTVLTIYDLCSRFTKPGGPHFSNAEESLVRENFQGYRNLFERWPCRFKYQLLCCVDCKKSGKVLKLNPDFSAVMFRLEGHNHNAACPPGCPISSPFVAYLHSGRGMSINTHFRGSGEIDRERVKLQHSRYSWQVQCRSQTIAAWIWVLLSITAGAFMVVSNWKEGWMEALIGGFELLSIMPIAVFGFVKLWVHDEAVLFRVMTGYRALNSRRAMLQYLTKLSDIEEGKADLSRDMSGDEQFKSPDDGNFETKGTEG